ncbi:hypothetical protein ACLQ25_31530 [Micromonospora sp. DT44]|uniref:hypothetical protein n=1 Tax=Micromonospora sp. DT44 TaxID=3393439 RepID=UPI003CF9617E
MSYEMFVQRFEQGDAAPMAADGFLAVFEPHADHRESQDDYWHISADDGGTADVYADLADDTFGSLMISRFSAGAVLDLLVTFIGLADAVVLPPGCPTLLAHEGQRHHLPEKFARARWSFEQARTWSRSSGTARNRHPADRSERPRAHCTQHLWQSWTLAVISWDCQLNGVTGS